MKDIFDENAKHVKWIKECEEYRNKNNIVLNNENNNIDNLRHQYSRFNLNKIGRLLANLITIMENKQYYYMRGNNFATHYNWENDHPETKKVKYTTAVISPNPQRKFLITSVHNNEFVFPEDTIVLSNSEEYESDVYLYDKNGNFIFNNYPYAKEFVDKLIEYRINNNTFEVTDEIVDNIFNKAKVKQRTK